MGKLKKTILEVLGSTERLEKMVLGLEIGEELVVMRVRGTYRVVKVRRST